MGRVSESDRKMFRQLVRDCMASDLDTEEALEYIAERTGGRKLSRSKFFDVKKEISKNQEKIVQVRLTEHTRIGFVQVHFEITDGLKDVLKILSTLLHEEFMKPVENRNLILLSRIARDILDYSKFIRQLNIDTPYVKRMKEEISNAREIQREAINRADDDEPVVE
jgi:hypothetical protein